jgi:predicted nucleic acid-binding protein
LTRFVLDASITTLWYANEPLSAAASVLLEGEDELHAPDLLFVETANALWKKQLRDEMGAEVVEESLAHLLTVDLVIGKAATLLKSATRLAVAARHPVYDCVYLTLAQEKDAVLATEDKRLLRLAARESVRIWSPGRG